MTRPSAGIDRQHVCRLVTRAIDPAVPDRELLHRFADRRDEAAFDALLRRHGPMVLATGRRVLGNAHDAEDVFQAAFALLAQKAASQRWQPSVASWLYQTVHLLALKTRQSATRRTRRERRAVTRSPANPLAELTGQELLAVLDEELLALPEPLRAPLVLCYLEGRTRDEAAECLGCSPSALKKRLERGRDRLHDALGRRGLGLSVALLGTLVAGGTAAALPGELAKRTSHAAQALANGNAADGVVSARVGQLVHQGIGMTGVNKVKAALGVLLLGGLLATAGAVASSTGDDPPIPTVPKSAPDQPPAPPAAPAAAGVMRVVVLGPEGKPLPGANVLASIWTDEEDFKATRDIETDAAGVARVELPKTFTTLRLWAGKKPFVTLHASWEQGELAGAKGVPAEYTFRLETAVTAGGRILDEKGNPVAGAKVWVQLTNDPKPARSDGRLHYAYALAWGSDAATADAEGRWCIENVPDHADAELSLLVTHPDYVSGRWARTARKAEITTGELRKGTATLTLKAGVVVRGTVTDPDGKPIKDAIVIHGDDPYSGHTTSTFSTDADGRFRLPALAPGKTSLTVIAPGWAPQFRKLDLKSDLPNQDVRMAKGQPVRLRFVDAGGKPVPSASVELLKWQGSESIYSGRNPNHPKVPDTGIPGRADAGGVWEWRAAPAEPVKIRISAKGFATLEMDVTAGATDRTVTLTAEHRVIGTVTDALTGKPIPNFTVIPVDVFRKDFLATERYHAVAGKAGRLEFLARRTDISLRLRIEAPGYRTQDGPEFRVGEDAGRKQDFRLTPSRPITGVVVDAAGKPARKAEVLLATPTEQVRLSRDDNHRAFTDASGRFEFPDPGEPWAVIARTDAGFALAEFPADRADAGALKLRPWGAVRGAFSDGGKPVRGATVFASPVRVLDLTRPCVEFGLQATTDADGRFEFPRVPPGAVSVRVHLGPWKDKGFRSGPSAPLDLQPGERIELNLGSGGATLTGKVKLTGTVPADLDCTYSLNYLVRREPGIAPPPEVAAAGFDARKGWRDSWRQTTEGLVYLSTLSSWFVKLAPDGTFRVSGVPAGEYDLAVAVYAKPSGCLIDPLARRVVRVTVTAADAARGELKVPEVTAEVEAVPAVGDEPALSFQRADGKDGTLADCRDKYTVVHFWESWCAPCKKQLPALKKLHERFAARGLATLSLSLDEDPAAWRAALKGLDLPWAQGRLGAGGAAGVSGVPAYWLLDPAGKIVAKVDDPDQLAAALEDKLKRVPAER
ncbi:sigma-70 family RNA polymerase sigma factor [Frigoriglobus tundricola]|uniref:Thioredoxin domain-containing protein n=1 Tax=Frigoriglobus tundricola TaxID=2774151 RepID=A0A6M5YVU3_9BACT|nr:sigma-70 family RNA polymerase sigma factor [Frigoriglobus tundricola]QJW97022.1 hypothetical protein FTUN_4582 [Frigoriglobus tundricola]